jgi:hypothetical protein
LSTLFIKNHGGLIVETNYWQLPRDRGELLRVSINAGAFRLLLRPEAEAAIADMRTARECVVSRGPWPGAGLADALEILFDDASADPFALHLQVESFDRVPPDSDAGREWLLSVWTRPRRGDAPHKALERIAFYRRVPSIPWLRPRTEAR